MKYPEDFEKKRAHLAMCKHNPPRSTIGQLGSKDTCACGTRTFVLRYSGNDGSGRVRKRWDRWQG